MGSFEDWRWDNYRYEVWLENKRREDRAWEEKRAKERAEKEEEYRRKDAEQQWLQQQQQWLHLWRRYQEAFQAKDFHEALYILDLLLTRTLDNHNVRSELLFLKGRCLFELKFYNEALASFKLSFFTPSNSIKHERLWYWEGLTQYMKESFFSAIANFDLVIRINPHYLDVHYWRARCYMNCGKYEEALDDFEQELLLDPQSHAQEGRGRCFERIKRYDLAIREFTKALKLRPQKADIYISRAYNYFMLNQYREALADYDQALQLDPENPFVYYWRAHVLEQIGDLKGALADITQDVQMYPNKGNPLLYRGQLQLKMGNTEQGRRDLRLAIELFTKAADEEGANLARKVLEKSFVLS